MIVNRGTIVNIEDEVYSSVGSTSYRIGDYALFKGNSDFEIWTGAGRTGTKLIENTDYILSDIDADSTAELGFTVYTTVQVITPSYQIIDLYHWYVQVGNYVNAETINGLLSDMETALNTWSPGAQDGIFISNNSTDSNNDIDFSTGTVASNDYTKMTLSTVLTKQLDAIFTEGTDAGGLFSGSKSTDTWYYCFTIKKDSDGSIDAGFSTDIDASDIPSGYSEYRRRGAIYTDSSGDIIQFFQHDDYFYYETVISDRVNTNFGTTSRVLQDVTAPPNYLAIVVPVIVENSLAMMTITSTETTDDTPSNVFRDIETSGSGARASLEMTIHVDSNSQIAIRSDVSGASASMYTKGFIDKRI